jgi:exopolysaccharide biosynthesis protein
MRRDLEIATMSRQETINMDDVVEKINKEGFRDSNNEADGILQNNSAIVEAM